MIYLQLIIKRVAATQSRGTNVVGNIMNRLENKTLEELLSAYSEGKRHFLNWDFEEDGSVKGMDLPGIFFENCFLFLDFRESNLSNSKFICCNIKTADFRDSDLSNAKFKNCSVESAMFKGAKTENLIFEENYCYGKILNQNDFEEIFINTDEFYTNVKLTNGFPNTNGIGNLLTGIIINGQINVNDLLILNNGTKVPILEVEFHNVIPGQRNFTITIPREYDDSENWYKLFGTELKIKNTTYNSGLAL